ncbi:MAG TPA: GNAT family N-acetyltransferase [Acidobacteriaceae bacterium]|nr:GNAT family N-acetyltransferase [Acidobacteriaceae bacterium]
MAQEKQIEIKRLTADDPQQARTMFAMMAEIFSEDFVPLSDLYIQRLLRRGEFWALAAFEGGRVVGGITAHQLPMTRNEISELFLYDIAVRTGHRRRGVGRSLVHTLRDLARKAGIGAVFVSADDEDTHALDFYRSLGGEPSPVTIFDFPATLEASKSR